MTVTAIRPLSERDTAWLAGLIEGEGCIDAQGVNPRIRVKMTDLDIVMRAASLMSTGYYGDEDGLRRGHKMAYVAQVTGPRAAYILRAILPDLGIRRSTKATEILSSYDARGRRVTLQAVPARMAA